MKNSVRENLFFRIKWLRQIVDTKISLSSSELLALANMRSFCNLSKNGWFDKISYNTLKREAKIYCPETTDIPDVTDYWDYLIDLRQQANEKAFNNSRLDGNQELPNSNDLVKKSLMDAHLCSMAYLEIFSFLESLTTKNLSSNEELKLLISNQLSISSEKFRIIKSFTDIETDRTKLKLIPGGKK